MFAKNKLSIAIAVASGSLVLASMQSVQAASVFFPQIAVSENVSTIVSLIWRGRTNDASGNGGDAYSEQSMRNALHYRVYYKTADDNTLPCEEYNYVLPTSPNDIQSFDIGGNMGAAATRGVLFNDPSVNNNWNVTGNDWQMLGGFPAARAYLVVDDRNPRIGTAPVNDPSAYSLAGEAMLIDWNSGAAWTYQAFVQDTDDPTTVSTVPGNEFDYQREKMPNSSPIHVFPLNQFNSGYLVTPLNINDQMAAGTNWATGNMVPAMNNYVAQIGFVTNDPSYGPLALYNRDEGGISGTLAPRVTCIGKVRVGELLTQGARDALANGGWGALSARRALVPSATDVNILAPVQPAWSGVTGAVVYKVEYNSGPITIGTELIDGIFNTGELVSPLFTE